MCINLQSFPLEWYRGILPLYFMLLPFDVAQRVHALIMQKFITMQYRLVIELKHKIQK